MEKQMEARTYCSAMMELGMSNSPQNLVVLTLACAAAAWLELEGTGGGDQEDKSRASCPRLKNRASEKPIAEGGREGGAWEVWASLAQGGGEWIDVFP